MVTRIKRQGAAERRRKVRVDELKLNKETVKDLSAREQKLIEGGRVKRTMPDHEFECGTYLYPGGPCGVRTQLDCI